MSEQIREQVSAFLDGELPSSETDLLLKRLSRDAELRQSFGRYTLIGEAMRGTTRTYASGDFLERVNRAVDGEPAAIPSVAPVEAPRTARWWRPFAGAAVAAGVAAVAVVALQQRANGPALVASTETPAVVSATQSGAVHEPVSYTTPTVVSGAGVTATPAAYSAGRMRKYVFAHSKYSSVLGQSNVISGLLSDSDEQEAAAVGRGAGGAPPQSRQAP